MRNSNLSEQKKKSYYPKPMPFRIHMHNKKLLLLTLNGERKRLEETGTS